MQLTELYQTVGTIALDKVNVNSYFPTSPYIALQQKSVSYASVCFAVESVRDEEDIRTYRAIIYYADRLTNDGSNWISIQDNATNVLWSIIEDLRNTEGIVDIEYDYTIEFFNQRMSDYLAGGYAEINIEVPLDNCIEM